jgi:hypothetical protein
MLVMVAEMSVQVAAGVALSFERPRFAGVVDLLAEGYDPVAPVGMVISR